MPEYQPQPERARPRLQPIPALKRGPVPAVQAAGRGTPAAKWLKAAAVAVFFAGLAAAIAGQSSRKGLMSHLTPKPAVPALAAPALPPPPVFAPRPASVAPAVQETASERPWDVMLPFASRQDGAAADDLVPYAAPQAKPAAPAAPQAVSAQKASPMPLRAPFEFRNSIFEKPAPAAWKTGQAAPDARTSWIPAPCDWKVSAPGATCWQSGGLLIKNQGVQQSAVKVGVQQGPSGVWYQPGVSAPTAAPPGASGAATAPAPAGPASK